MSDRNGIIRFVESRDQLRKKKFKKTAKKRASSSCSNENNSEGQDVDNTYYEDSPGAIW